MIYCALIPKFPLLSAFTVTAFVASYDDDCRLPCANIYFCSFAGPVNLKISVIGCIIFDYYSTLRSLIGRGMELT